MLPSYLPAAIADPHAIIAKRAEEKTAKHADGSAARGRLFIPWVLTTFFGMGPASVWYFVDSVYASSAALARRAQSSFHAVSVRKAAFLACAQAPFVRSCYSMLTTHTAGPAARPPSSTSTTPLPTAPSDPDAPPSPASSRPTTPEPADPPS